MRSLLISPPVARDDAQFKSVGSFLAPSSIPGTSKDDAEFLRQYLELVGHHPNQFSYHGRALVSTFAGDQCTFGQDSLAAGWRVARSALERVCPASSHTNHRHVQQHIDAHAFMNARFISSLPSLLIQHAILR